MMIDVIPASERSNEKWKNHVAFRKVIDGVEMYVVVHEMVFGYGRDAVGKRVYRRG